MIDALTSRDRRAAIVGVVAIGSLVLGFRAVPAWWRWRADVRETAAEAIAQERRVTGVVAGFSQSLDSLGARVDRLKHMGPAFLTGATPTEAASMLATILGETARTSLVRIDAIEIHVDSASGSDMPRVRVEAQAVGDISGLAVLLQRLERGPTLLAVRRLSVQPQAVDGPAGQVESLAIHVTIEGLVLPTPRGRTP
jgi:hypothetical protein